MAGIRAVAFDMIGTVFPLDPLRGRLSAAGLEPDDLETWFATALRDAFALSATGAFAPFTDVLKSALAEVMARRGEIDDARGESVLAGMSQLVADPEAGAAFRKARHAGLRIVALTNGGAESTRSLLETSGLRDLVDSEISVEEVRAFKPAKAIYLHAAARLGLQPSELALVAAHPWDIHGGKSAGLVAAYVERKTPMPAFMLRPDVTAGSLPAAVDGLIAK